jgi:hypothetical protein
MNTPDNKPPFKAPIAKAPDTDRLLRDAKLLLQGSLAKLQKKLMGSDSLTMTEAKLFADTLGLIIKMKSLESTDTEVDNMTEEELLEKVKEQYPALTLVPPPEDQ